MTVFIILCAVLVLLLAALTAASLYFYSFVVSRKNKAFLQGFVPTEAETSSPEIVINEQSTPANEYLAAIDWMNAQKCETWTITSDDGLRLTGYYLKAAAEIDKTVIIAHGYRSKGKDSAVFARFFYEKLGYNVLLPDARGHGESAGSCIGFGWPERHDYLKWIQKIIDFNGSGCKIVLFGGSMGGATVMMVSGENLPQQVKAVVEDCGYSSVSAELSHQLKMMFKLPRFPLVYTTSLVTRFKAGYGFFEASSVKQVAKSKVPMLFIHGAADTFVPVSMVHEVYNACPNNKDILIVEGAEHGMAYATDKTAYETKVEEFLDRFMHM